MHNRRQNGMDKNPISDPEIESWLNLNGFIDRQVRQDICRFVTFLDDTWLTMYYNDQEKKRKKADKKKRK